MKKLPVFIGLFTLFTIFLMGCRSEAYGPEKVATDFLTYMAEGDFDGARALCTEETAQIVSFAEAIGMGKEHFSDVSDLRCETEGDRAYCTYIHKGEPESLNLIQKDGKWLVHIEK